jgi:hypothetical protein
MRTKELESLLKARYSGAEYALFFNVADGTGAGVGRWADAIAINLWPSRGLEIEGFELKVSRGDWQRELANPAKAEAVCKYCDRWSVVVAEAGIVRDGELPPTWGLMVANGNGLRVAVKPPKLKPCELDHSFVAAIARRATEQGAEAEALKAEYDRGVESGKQAGSYDRRKLEETAERVKAFTLATGIDLNADYTSRFHWQDPTKIGAAVLQVLKEGDGIVSQMMQLRTYAATVVGEIDSMLDVKPIPEPKRRRRA